MPKNRYYFSTRDLLLMAALAALGGVTSTYINMAGRVVQSFIGIPGGMQWAAGLHVLWLTLAVGLTGKQGTGTVTGIVKGFVELLTGNTHGLLVVLVDIIAGILVDVGFLPFRDKDRLPGYLLAGGLASFSNVIIFQLFAVLPADILSYGAMMLIGAIAGLSGIVFAGFLGHALTSTLRRAGVVKDRPAQPLHRRVYPAFLIGVALMATLLAIYLHGAVRGAAQIPIDGAVDAPYTYPQEHGDLPTITAGDATHYTGVLLRELIAQAQPQAEAELVLVQATDGYAFFISMDEVQTNANLLLASQGTGSKTSYDIVGAANTKAQVRGVSHLTVVGAATLEIGGALGKPAPFNPDDWQFEMDSITLDVGNGPQKLQGAPLSEVLKALEPAPEATTVVLFTPEEPITIPLDRALRDDETRIFTVIGTERVTFAVAQMDGTVIAPQVTRIEVNGR
ncbi:MAG TPA: ECF transporter S component [Anaerolineae bacterium]|nr:ECF transporter S component [Anaerolineae bacterium]HQH39716.1 ECF transporter S component [Anaerolineae bacterium]